MLRITDEQLDKLRNNSEMLMDECLPVLRLQDDLKSRTWLLFKFDQKEKLFYGLYGIKGRMPKVRPISLTGTGDANEEFKLDAEFSPKYKMSAYLRAANFLRCLTENEVWLSAMSQSSDFEIIKPVGHLNHPAPQ